MNSISKADLGEGPYGNLDKRIIMKSCGLEGRGLFADAFIPKGSIVWVNMPNGPMNANYPILTFDQLMQLNEEYRDCVLKYGSQLSENTIQGPLTEEAAMHDYSNFFNHSCSPNVWPIDTNHWEARYDIAPGEELTIDYVTFDCNDFAGTLKCKCGSKDCRGKIAAEDYKSTDLQKKYYGHFVDFIQVLIDRITD